MEDETRGGGELDNLHIKFRREALEAQKQRAAGGGADKKKKAGGAAAAGAKDGGKDGGGAKDGGKDGDKAGGAGGDGQQQAEGGGEGGQLVEVDPEQQVGRRAAGAAWDGAIWCGLRPWLRPAVWGACEPAWMGRRRPARASRVHLPIDKPRTLLPPPPPLASCQRLMEAFKAAAEAVKEQAMPVEERVAKWLRRWMKVGRHGWAGLGAAGWGAGASPLATAAVPPTHPPHRAVACACSPLAQPKHTPFARWPAQDWEEDLEARPDDIKGTAAGAAAPPAAVRAWRLHPAAARLRQSTAQSRCVCC